MSQSMVWGHGSKGPSKGYVRSKVPGTGEGSRSVHVPVGGGSCQAGISPLRTHGGPPHLTVPEQNDRRL